MRVVPETCMPCNGAASFSKPTIVFWSPCGHGNDGPSYLGEGEVEGKTLVASFAALRYGYDAMALQLRVVSVECLLRRRAECVSVIYLVFDAG
jgi:hypothetical protein